MASLCWCFSMYHTYKLYSTVSVPDSWFILTSQTMLCSSQRNSWFCFNLWKISDLIVWGIETGEKGCFAMRAINIVFTDRICILCLSCNATRYKPTAKFYWKRAEKSVSIVMVFFVMFVLYWCHFMVFFVMSVVYWCHFMVFFVMSVLYWCHFMVFFVMSVLYWCYFIQFTLHQSATIKLLFVFYTNKAKFICIPLFYSKYNDCQIFWDIKVKLSWNCHT